MLRKNVSLIIAMLLMFSLVVSVSAGNNPRVYADNVKCDVGEVITIPVYIENNAGIMGFRITVDYSSEAFENPSVVKGSVTKNGSFNDSITGATKETFDVLWSNTENIKADGTLFAVELKVKDTAATDKYSVGISYEQADTFNEKWQDVKLDCSDVEVIVGDYVEPEIPEEPTMTFLESIMVFFRRLFEIVASWFV